MHLDLSHCLKTVDYRGEILSPIWGYLLYSSLLWHRVTVPARQAT
jgi:hypothetical protein